MEAGHRRSLTGPSLERPALPLTVEIHLQKRWSAQRSAATCSHGGSQGFKSPHLHPLHPTPDDQRQRSSSGVAVSRGTLHNGWRAAPLPMSGPWPLLERRASRCDLAAGAGRDGACNVAGRPAGADSLRPARQSVALPAALVRAVPAGPAGRHRRGQPLPQEHDPYGVAAAIRSWWRDSSWGQVCGGGRSGGLVFVS